MRETQAPPPKSSFSRVRRYLRGIPRQNLIAWAILLAVLFLALARRIGVQKSKSNGCPRIPIDEHEYAAHTRRQVWGSDIRHPAAELVKVVAGARNAEYTLVVGGLRAGDEVVSAGHTGLQPGMAVVATEWSKDGPRVLPTAAATGAIRLDSSNNWTFVQKEADLSIALTMEVKPAKGANNSW